MLTQVGHSSRARQGPGRVQDDKRWVHDVSAREMPVSAADRTQRPRKWQAWASAANDTRRNRPKRGRRRRVEVTYRGAIKNYPSVKVTSFCAVSRTCTCKRRFTIWCGTRLGEALRHRCHSSPEQSGRIDRHTLLYTYALLTSDQAKHIHVSVFLSNTIARSCSFQGTSRRARDACISSTGLLPLNYMVERNSLTLPASHSRASLARIVWPAPGISPDIELTIGLASR